MTGIGMKAGAQALSKPINDLYNLAKGATKSKLEKNRTARKIGQLHRKLSSVQKVKTIWQVDKEVNLKTFYYPSCVIIEKERTPVNTISKLPSGNLIIKGIVGQGKSIFLRYLCAQELAQATRIPIFFELRRMLPGETLKGNLFTVLSNLGFDVDENLFDYLAHSGKLVLLLDAFDELDQSLITAAVKELEGLADRYSEMQVIITARPDTDIEHSPFYRVVQLAPLTHDDIPPLLKKLVDSDAKAKEIQKVLEQSATQILSLLTTPLMVTLLVMVYKFDQKIPSALSEFYDHLFQTLLCRHDKSKPGFVRNRKCKINERQLQLLFEAFCYISRRRGISTLGQGEVDTCVAKAIECTGIQCDSHDFVSDVSKVTCLLLEEGFKYHFIHKSVQEFYAASFISQRPDALGKAFYEGLTNNSKWAHWRQELEFLSQIDKFRYLKYFWIPDLRHTLGMLGIDPDGKPKTPSAETIKALLKNMLVHYQVTGPSEGRLTAISRISTASFSTVNFLDRIFGRFAPILRRLEINELPPGVNAPFSGKTVHSVDIGLDQIADHYRIIPPSRELLTPMLKEAFEKLRAAEHFVEHEEDMLGMLTP